MQLANSILEFCDGKAGFPQDARWAESFLSESPSEALFSVLIYKVRRLYIYIPGQIIDEILEGQGAQATCSDVKTIEMTLVSYKIGIRTSGIWPPVRHTRLPQHPMVS